MSRTQINYIPILYDLSKTFQPNTILELGCGVSSYLLRWLFHTAELWIIDDDSRWLAMVHDMIAYKVNMMIAVQPNSKQEWFDVMRQKRWDLIFIDSGHQYDKSDMWRIDFLELIRKEKLLNINGRIILHDADREEYQAELKHWQIIRHDDSTVLLSYCPEVIT